MDPLKAQRLLVHILGTYLHEKPYTTVVIESEDRHGQRTLTRPLEALD